MLFVVFGKMGKFVDYSVIDNGLTVNMENNSQHTTKQNIVLADKVNFQKDDFNRDC